MAGFTDATEQDLLDHFVDSYIAATKYIGLSTSVPTEAGGSFTEPTEASYDRVSTTGADWSAATGTSPASKSNSAVKTFPTAAEDWGAGVNMTHFGIFDATSAGNLLAWGVLGTPKPVLTDDTASFGAGSLVLQMGDPTDF